MYGKRLKKGIWNSKSQNVVVVVVVCAEMPTLL
jgi:hypothetical protein